MRAWRLIAAGLWLWAAGGPTCAADDPPQLVLDAGGHTSLVRKVLFTPDGKELITVSDDKSIRFWDVASGEPIRTLRPPIGPGHQGKLSAAALSPDGELLAVGGFGFGVGQHGLFLVDPQAPRIVRHFVGHANAVNALSYSPDGVRLLSASIDNTARLWNIADGRQLHLLEGHTGAIYGADFSPDGTRCATASYDRTAAVWSVDTGRRLAVLTGHQAEAQAVDWSPDGQRLVTAGRDGSLRIWKPNGELLTTLQDEVAGRTFKAVQFNRTGDALLFAHGYTQKNNGFTGITAADRIQLRSQFKQHDNTILDAVFSPDGTLIASAGGERNPVYLWRADTGQLVQKFVGRSSTRWGAAWRGDGQAVAWGESARRATDAAPYPLSRTLDLTTWELGAFSGPESAWNRAATSRGGLDAVLTETSRVDLKSGDRVAMTLEPTDDYDRNYNRAYCATFLPRGRAAVGGSLDLWIYDVATGNRLRRLVGHTAAVYSVAVSPDGRYLLSAGGDHTLRIWPLDFDVSGRVPREVLGQQSLQFLESVGLAKSFDSPHGFFAIPNRLKDSTQESHRRFGETFRTQHAAEYEAAKSALITGIPPLLSFFCTDEEWIAWTPEGYYAASPGGERLMGWQVNHGFDRFASFYPAAQFHKQFYRPDVIRRLLAAGSVERALQEPGKSEPKRDVAQHLPPLVEIVSPAEPAITVAGAELSVEVVATPVGGQPVTSLQLLVNGRPFGGRGGVVRIADSTVPRHTFTVPLLSGAKYTLQARADSPGSYGLSTVVEATARAAADEDILPNLYVLAIGVADYDDDALRLSFADDDARRLAEAFSQHARHLYRKVEVNVILDKAATQRGILGGLAWLKQQCTQHDVGVLFFSGHGDRDEEATFYLLPSDVNRELPLLASGVPETQLRGILQGLPCRLLVLLDCCHAGTFGGDRRKGAFSLTDDLVRDLATDDYGIVTMASSLGRQLSLESAAEQSGLFTQALVEALAGQADYNRDGTVYFNELDAYVSERVKTLSQGRQTPTTAKPATVRSFPLARTPTTH